MNGPHPDRVGDKELLDVAARAIDQMIRDMREMTLQRNEWRAQARALARANEALARTPLSRIRGRVGRLARGLRGGSRDESPGESDDEPDDEPDVETDVETDGEGRP